MWVDKELGSFRDGETIRVVSKASDVNVVTGMYRGMCVERVRIESDGETAHYNPTYYKFQGWSPDGKVNPQPAEKCAAVVVGNQTYNLKPGDHLRVWWEDGALWSELVQG